MKGYFFEMNACEGGCLGGPYLLAYRQNEWPAQSRLAKYEDSKKIEPHFDSRFINSYFDQSVKHPPYSEEQIQSALNSMGKRSFEMLRLWCLWI